LNRIVNSNYQQDDILILSKISDLIKSGLMQNISQTLISL